MDHLAGRLSVDLADFFTTAANTSCSAMKRLKSRQMATRFSHGVRDRPLCCGNEASPLLPLLPRLDGTSATTSGALSERRSRQPALRPRLDREDEAQGRAVIVTTSGRYGFLETFGITVPEENGVRPWLAAHPE